MSPEEANQMDLVEKSPVIIYTKNQKKRLRKKERKMREEKEAEASREKEKEKEKPSSGEKMDPSGDKEKPSSGEKQLKIPSREEAKLNRFLEKFYEKAKELNGPDRLLVEQRLEIFVTQRRKSIEQRAARRLEELELEQKGKVLEQKGKASGEKKEASGDKEKPSSGEKQLKIPSREEAKLNRFLEKFNEKVKELNGPDRQVVEQRLEIFVTQKRKSIEQRAACRLADDELELEQKGKGQEAVLVS